MHWKTKQKLRRATKLYIVEPEHDKTNEIKIQLSKIEYCCIYLNEPFSQKIEYKDLRARGFNYDPSRDTHIVHYSSKEVIRVLRNSINFSDNNNDTIEKLIELIQSLENKHI
ncbi:hypothetical protein DVK85_01410 [Flavobacterium arcticum]|uniref:Uncharacterized protein n=1 Tax=Flavobacterium arcticum TaxID=1784713 RepID=A0A345H8Q0_9FLAO|nr:hypothetical protein [Flavobacterium arcticum]AXG72960.1 hypothetical protein DVK85_01410 [Flavobacterium arcticum]KAF2510376.1 hypothetical protein E0W72_07795 [Flavobacterium arcticum]